jgi:hypothetical protein
MHLRGRTLTSLSIAAFVLAAARAACSGVPRGEIATANKVATTPAIPTKPGGKYCPGQGASGGGCCAAFHWCVMFSVRLRRYRFPFRFGIASQECCLPLVQRLLDAFSRNATLDILSRSCATHSRCRRRRCPVLRVDRMSASPDVGPCRAVPIVHSK